MKNITPIKRHPAFVALSQDHHLGLLLVWKIKKGLSDGIVPGRISNYILYFFEVDLRHHFREEEELIYSKLPADDKLRLQGEDDHDKIYTLIEEIGDNKTDRDLLLHFADLLKDHIRIEERVLFNHLQQIWEPAQLDEVVQHSTERGVNCDAGYFDPFWLKKKE